MLKFPYSKVAGVVALLLAACAQSTPPARDSLDTRPRPPSPAPAATAPVPAPAPTPAASTAPLRVIVTFKNAVDYQSAAWLQTLKDQLHATQVTYVSLVHGNTHVYLIQIPQGQDVQHMLSRLQSLPIVQSAELDRIAKAS